MTATVDLLAIAAVFLIASTFTPEVQRWSGKIGSWSDEYGLEPNLMATVMQIESCGHPTVSSPSGAQGLFQVMPFHFASDESMTDPEHSRHSVERVAPLASRMRTHASSWAAKSPL